MVPGILFYGDVLKFDFISNSHKDKEKKILNKIKEKKTNYLKLSGGFNDAYSKKVNSNQEKTTK